MKTQRQLEQGHVAETIAIIDNETQLLKKQQQVAQSIMKEASSQTGEQQIRFGSDEAFYESAMDYRLHEQELLIRYKTLEAQEKRLKALDIMEGNPYFARIDFTEEAEQEKLYIGIASLRDTKENPMVIDWRAPIANLYYESELGATSYEAVDGWHDVSLDLKRQFKIRDGEIQSMVDTSDTLTDDFLLDILDETSSDKMKNIVSTIQKSQNAIIRDKHKHLMVQGIAGSGKTSALLQRVAYIIYSNRKWLDPEQVLLFSPNHLFSDYISTVLPSLGESGIPTETFQIFLRRLLPQYTIINEMQQEENFLTGKENKSNRLKSGISLPAFLDKYAASITELGPLFSDLKITGETIIPKEKIRFWYQETNDQLPMYQRMQLLQTKLLKKIGGLQKDEAKKDWVKAAVEAVIDEVVANDPNFEDTEQNERKLRRKLAQKIVADRFKPLVRKIHRYRFINYGKQYLHFLQSVPQSILLARNVSPAEWAQNIVEVKQRLRQKELLQEDGVLFFFLMSKIYPVDVYQKARFIFIDEMQDFSPSQVWLLRNLYPRAGFNFCGDLNQKVFDNETIVTLIDQLFPDQEVHQFELTTSYRSTKQITDFSSFLLAEESPIEATARDGKLPVLLETDNQTAGVLELTAKLTEFLQRNSYWRTAIIAKSLADCQALYGSLSEDLQAELQFIETEDDFMKKQIILIPAYLAKGLEFDQVFLWDANETSFNSPQDQLILYTMTTRAMHELTIFTNGPTSHFLQAVPETAYLKEV